MRRRMLPSKPFAQSEKRSEQKKPDHPLDQNWDDPRLARRWPMFDERQSRKMECQEQIRQERQPNVATKQQRKQKGLEADAPKQCFEKYSDT
jgi:hypothetical protein